MSYVYVAATVLLTVYGQLVVKWQVAEAARQGAPADRAAFLLVYTFGMLPGGWLPRGSANAIEAKHAEFRAEPEIPIGRLGNRVDVALDEATPDSPRHVRILADLKRGIQGEAATAACDKDPEQDGNSSH